MEQTYIAAIPAVRRMIAVSICPRCLQRNIFQHSTSEFTWNHCGEQWTADPAVFCPHSQCGAAFNFLGQANCPVCGGFLDSGVPLKPVWHERSILDVIVPKRRNVSHIQQQTLEDGFSELLESWSRESCMEPYSPSPTSRYLGAEYSAALRRHKQILDSFGSDLDKFLYTVPVKLARLEGEYSWKFEEALSKEIDELLQGLLTGRASVEQSLGYIVRCYGDNPRLFSRNFLANELKRLFHERRSAPRPGFQLTLEYARSLDGIAFEEWIVRLLRDAGIQQVQRTQDTRDQGADVVVEMDGRTIVIQAKQMKDTLGNACVQEVLAGRHFYHANEAWVVTTSTFSKDAIDLAYRTGVQLIDGSRLLNLATLLLTSHRANGDGSPPILNRHLPEISSPVPAINMVDENGASTTAEPQQVLQSSGSSDDIVPRPHHYSLKKVSLAVFFLLFLCFGMYGLYLLSTVARAKHDVQQVLDQYQDAVRTRNTQVLANCYAPVVENFYLKHNVSRSEVHTEFRKQFAAYTGVHKFNFSNITFHDVDADRVRLTDDREWSFQGAKDYAGSEREELVFRKIDGSWQIVSEIEVKIYWYRKGS